VDTATAAIQDGGVSLKVDTQHLRDVSFRTNSMYQFIGELLIRPDNDVQLSFLLKLFISLIFIQNRNNSASCSLLSRQFYKRASEGTSTG
jgi:hypothetical protein